MFVCLLDLTAKLGFVRGLHALAQGQGFVWSGSCFCAGWGTGAAAVLPAELICGAGVQLCSCGNRAIQLHSHVVLLGQEMRPGIQHARQEPHGTLAHPMGAQGIARQRTVAGC